MNILSKEESIKLIAKLQDGSINQKEYEDTSCSDENIEDNDINI